MFGVECDKNNWDTAKGSHIILPLLPRGRQAENYYARHKPILSPKQWILQAK